MHTSSNIACAKRYRHANAFTLIELLVVIAIVAILIGLLTPGLAKARLLGRSLKEQSAAHQQMIAFAAYYTDSHDKILVAAPHWAWNHVPRVREGMYPADPWQAGQYMEGSITKTWLWHFVGVTGYEKSVVQLDKATYADFMTRPNNGGTAQFTTYGSNSYAAALSYHPSLGYNGVYVGGAYTHGGFRGQAPCAQAHPGLNITHSAYGDPTPRGNPPQSGGMFYVEKSGDVRHPDQLLVFASSRGGDVREGSWWSWGASPPNTGVIRPGYWLITPPRPHPTQRGGYAAAVTLGGGWVASNTFDRLGAPSNWGQIDPRWQNKSVTAKFDGSVKMQSLEDLRDMRQWANHATAPDWNFQPGR